MTTTALRAVKFVGSRIDKFRDNQSLSDFGKSVEEVLKFGLYLFGPILLPWLIIYLEGLN
tara:strand:- start:55 stop:234 length:180 start_codon:yes stop_codon:yes gene_type:complete